MRVPTIYLLLTLTFAGASIVGCAGSTPATGVANPVPQAIDQPTRATGSIAESLKIPALVAFDTQAGALEYWPIRRNGSQQPRKLSAALGIFAGYGMAANGHVVAIANYSPAEVITYNVDTKAQVTLPDPYGGPFDIAIDKNGSLYALNSASVTVYPYRGSGAMKLTCSYINSSVAIAVDNESDVFVNGYGPGGFMGVVEFAAGSQTCTKVQIRPESGYAGGVGVDPKTDDLIVVDNPDLCAGGLEGRMVVYSKPYGPKTGRQHNLNATYCAGTFRLDATSTHIFVSDSTVSAGFPLIDQRTYPGSRGTGTYGNGNSGGFTTIPNTLPN